MDSGTFEMEIRIGNEAMSTPEDLAWALRRVAERLACGQSDGVIHDVNGNSVGSWAIEEDDTEK